MAGNPSQSASRCGNSTRPSARTSIASAGALASIACSRAFSRRTRAAAPRVRSPMNSMAPAAARRRKIDAPNVTAAPVLSTIMPA